MLSLPRFRDVYGPQELKQALEQGGLGPSLRGHARRELNAGTVDPLRHVEPEDWLVLDLDDFRGQHAKRFAG